MSSALPHDAADLLVSRLLRLQRHGRFLLAELKQPHRVLSTSQVNGGEREDLRFLVNHQSCEPAGHAERGHRVIELGHEAYHREVCDELGISPDDAAVLGTAANMQNAAIETAAYEDLEVTAVVTAGVGNAVRAGDPTQYHERNGRFQPINNGTINTLLLVNLPLSHAALSRAVVTMTEGKTAVLHELAIASRSGRGFATGTGTDQYAIASPIGAPEDELTWSGSHTKLGELVATATMDALREALRWQSGLEPSLTRSLCQALGRFGLTENALRQELSSLLEPAAHKLFLDNFRPVVYDPQVAGCAYAIAAVQDRLLYGTLPASAADEIILNQCALMAAVLAARPAAFPQMRRELAAGGGVLKERVLQAIALGWRTKWT